MLRSMTAYGRSEVSEACGTLTWELRAVNHRYLDLSLRLAEDLRPIETEARRRLSTHLQRGKVEVSLRYKPGASETALNLQCETLKALMEKSEQICSKYPQVQPLRAVDVLSWPGVTETVKSDMKQLQQAALALLDRAIEDFVAAREREGAAISVLITERIDAIAPLLERLRVLRPQVNERLKGRLLGRLSELDLEIDPARLEQELVLQATRLDVDEEIDRLHAHLAEVRKVLKRREPVGRRLDFLMQELNREANTLGSKSNDSETTAVSVDLKVLIEQMREQIQNIE